VDGEKGGRLLFEYVLSCFSVSKYIPLQRLVFSSVFYFLLILISLLIKSFFININRIATAYAVVKLLLPVRIGFSLWATPWMARMIFIPVGRVLQKIRSSLQRGGR